MMLVARDIGEESAAQPGIQPRKERVEVSAIRGDELRARGRCGRAYIGNKVGDGEVGLMAHGGYRRHRTRRHRPGHPFEVEGPQILQ